MLPAPTAVALSYTLSSHATWQTLLELADGDVTEVTHLANEALSSALFHH